MCMTILVGKKASASGEVLVAHNEDAPGRYIMQTHLVHKKRRHPGTMITFEPDLAKLPLNETRTSLFWAEAKTFDAERPGPSFCDLYVNGYGVVICTNNCASSKEDSPELKDGGIGYGLRRLIAEKAHTAKEALEIACKLVDEYGYASSGRSYAFADKDEIFVMQIVHGKHYAIARVPDDEVAVIPNHYTIHEPDKKAHGYKELIDYAVKRGWYKPEDGVFDFAKVYQAENSYGLEKNTHRHVRAFEILLTMNLGALLQSEWQPLPFSIKPAYKVTIPTLKRILRTHYEGTSSDKSNGKTPHFMKPLTVCNIDTLESTIIQIRHNPYRIILRKALGRPCYSSYLTWYYGINSSPEGYEDKEPEKSLAEHFKTKPEDLDYKNNAWFRAMEIQAACDILYEDKKEVVREKIKALEEKQENDLHMLDQQIELRLRNNPDIARAMMEGAVISWSNEIEDLMNSLKSELKIVNGEALNAIIKGESFQVKISDKSINLDELEISECKCGPSYLDVSEWSKCAGISEDEIDFAPAEWMKDAVPCFTDLYMLLIDKSGKKRAGCVKIQIR
ncbi:MAG: C69 family dipeptidase [Synergistaceae bacterium]|nr:C69 family dipeptidase [Synergistaceae bacterium]